MQKLYSYKGLDWHMWNKAITCHNAQTSGTLWREDLWERSSLRQLFALQEQKHIAISSGARVISLFNMHVRRKVVQH